MTTGKQLSNVLRRLSKMHLRPLKIQHSSDTALTNMPNFELKHWPPQDTDPIMCDEKGQVVSYFADNIWKLTPYATKSLSLNFGVPVYGQKYVLDLENMRLFKTIACYWLYGIDQVNTVTNLINRCDILKPLIYTCSIHGILISELSDHPEIFEAIAQKYKSRKKLIFLLENLLMASNEIGFTILDKYALKNFRNYDNKVEYEQFAYIPPRIWLYQVKRLEACIDDFVLNQNNIQQAFAELLVVYEKYPTNKRPNRIPREKLCHEILEKYSIYSLFETWLGYNKNNAKITYFSSYLSLVTKACLAFIANFSLMRSGEAHSLKYGCFHTDIVDGETYYFIRGKTTKTQQDENAVWVVPKIVEKAVKVAEAICELRFNYANSLALVQKTIDKAQPFLFISAYEPWCPSHKNIDLNKPYLNKQSRKYKELIDKWHKVFDKNEIIIQREDLKIAQEMTKKLNSEEYAVGKIWPFSWHQLRRTGAVNMLASGLVTEQSLQYQLKHANMFMSLYYANNFYKLNFKLDKSVGDLYLEELHQHKVRENVDLVKNHVVSPHGEKRKSQVISTVTQAEHDELLKRSKEGKIQYRQTLLGGCTKPGLPCAYGGFNDITHCMGGDNSVACQDVLLDKHKLAIMQKLEKSYQEKIDLSPESIDVTFYIQSLQAIRKAINVISS